MGETKNNFFELYKRIVKNNVPFRRALSSSAQTSLGHPTLRDSGNVAAVGAGLLGSANEAQGSHYARTGSPRASHVGSGFAKELQVACPTAPHPGAVTVGRRRSPLASGRQDETLRLGKSSSEGALLGNTTRGGARRKPPVSTMPEYRMSQGPVHR